MKGLLKIGMVIVVIYGIFMYIGDSKKEAEEEALQAKKRAELQQEIDPILKTANEAYDKDDYKTALPEYKKIIDKGYDDGIVWYRFAYCNKNVYGNNEDTKKYYDKAYSLLKKQYPDHRYTKLLDERENLRRLQSKKQKLAIKAGSEVVKNAMKSPSQTKVSNEEIVVHVRKGDKDYYVLRCVSESPNSFGVMLRSWILAAYAIGDDMATYTFTSGYGVQTFDTKPGKTEISLVRGFNGF